MGYFHINKCVLNLTEKQGLGGGGGGVVVGGKKE